MEKMSVSFILIRMGWHFGFSLNVRQVKDGTYVGYYDILLVNALVRAQSCKSILKATERALKIGLGG
jgi:hypothetical protein